MKRYTLDETKGDIRYEVEGDMLILKVRPEFVQNIPTGSVIDVIKTTDGTIPSDYNVFSASRTLQEIQKVSKGGKPTALYKDNLVDKYLYSDNGKNQAYLTYTLLGAGDIIAYASSDSVSTEFPIASYTQFGLFKGKDKGGLIFDAKDGWSIDPKMAGGGFDENKLRKFLSDNHYIYDGSPTKPLSSILNSGTKNTFLDGKGNFRQITVEDLGDLSEHYVTIATDQTVTGQKTFTKTILCNQDVVAYVSGSPTADIPIASQYQYGLSKYDNKTIGINDNGQLQVIGDVGGGTNVYWGASGSENFERLTVGDDTKEVSLNGHTHDAYVLRSDTGWVEIKDYAGKLKVKGVEHTVSLVGHTHSQYITDENNNIKKLVGSGNKDQYLNGLGSFATITHGQISGLSTNYVTIATDQTVTGQKTFTKTILCNQDVVAYVSGNPTADIPIASSKQYGLSKYDNVTIGINSSGQLFVKKDYTWNGGEVGKRVIIFDNGGGTSALLLKNRDESGPFDSDSMSVHFSMSKSWGKKALRLGVGDARAKNLYDSSYPINNTFTFAEDGIARASAWIDEGSAASLQAQPMMIMNVRSSLEKISDLEVFKDNIQGIDRYAVDVNSIRRNYPEVLYESNEEGEVAAVDSAKLACAVAIQGIQELSAQVNYLEGEIIQLKRIINELKARNNDTEGKGSTASV